MAGDQAGLREAAIDVGFFAEDTRADHADAVLQMMEIVFASLRSPGPFDFADTQVVETLRDAGMAMGQDPELVQDIVSAVKAAVDIPVVAKLTPNVPNIGEIAAAAAAGGSCAVLTDAGPASGANPGPFTA